MLDQKDKQIIDILQINSRISLTELSKKIKLSIDASHKRLKKLIKEEIIFPTILVDPRKIGYPITMDVKIKLKDIDKETYNQFIAHLVKHPNFIAVFSASGDYDITAPIIAKNYAQLNEISLEVRDKFKHLIADWKTAINLQIYKYEKYDMSKL
jgi:DNA-binding Lrp family transcriptional regulator